MQKLIAGILLVIGTSGIGYFYYLEMKTRISNLKQMKEIMVLIENEISYSKASLPNLCRTLERKVNGYYQKFFQRINQESKNLQRYSFLEVWVQSCEELRVELGAKNSDILMLQEFLGNQNYNNVEMQIKSLEFRRKELETCIEELEITLNNSKKMYLSLGVMSGLLASIILW